MHLEDHVVEGDLQVSTPDTSAEERKPFSTGWWRVLYILPAILIGFVFKPVLVFYLFLLVIILIHELGHFAAGHLCGFRLSRFRVGVVELRRPKIVDPPSPDTWDWKWHWGLADLFSGFIVMLPTGKSITRIRLRYFIYAIAGPISNIGTGLLALPVARAETGVGAAAKFFLAVSVFLGVTNFFPFTTKRGVKSDGGRLWAILCGNNPIDATTLYWFTLRERLAGTQSLFKAGRVEEAYAGAQELITDAQKLIQTALTTELIVRLTKLGEVYREALDQKRQREGAAPILSPGVIGGGQDASAE